MTNHLWNDEKTGWICCNYGMMLVINLPAGHPRLQSSLTSRIGGFTVFFTVFANERDTFGRATIFAATILSHEENKAIASTVCQALFKELFD